MLGNVEDHAESFEFFAEVWYGHNMTTTTNDSTNLYTTILY